MQGRLDDAEQAALKGGKKTIAKLEQRIRELESEWFAPHFEFRFPRIGDYKVKGITLELRSALEPWHVTGEHGAEDSSQARKCRPIDVVSASVPLPFGEHGLRVRKAYRRHRRAREPQQATGSAQR